MGKNNKKQSRGLKNKKDELAKNPEPIITDERFSQIYNDPKYRLIKSDNLKIKLDDRFKKEEFINTIDGHVTKIDKYGRKLKSGYSKNRNTLDQEFDKFFEKEDEKEDNMGDEDNIDRACGEERGSSSSESDSDSDSDSDLDSFGELESDEEIEIEEEKPEEGEPSSVLAAVNLDWDNINSKDLMFTFQSFIKNKQSIISITIYPSEYGKEKMAKEDVEGPSREFFKDNKKKNKKADDLESDSESDSDSDSDSDLEINDKRDFDQNKEKIIKKLYEEDEGVDYNSKKLRKYQLQRLRYYYAIIRCDSIETAQEIYKNCDGLEYESTANFFDLRYVPEDMEFDDDEKRDFCDKLPNNYKAKVDFTTSALQHSKVKLTWDETPAERLEMATKAFNQKEIEDMDFKAYLASDSEEEEEIEKLNGKSSKKRAKEIKNKYKDLVNKSIMIGDQSIFDGFEDKSKDVDMEITFTPGIADETNESEKNGDGEKEETETTLDKYKRKASERRKARMDKIKEEKEKEKEEKKALKESRRNKHRRKHQDESDDEASREDKAKSKAELELLLMDEDNDKKHFNLKEIMKAEKQEMKNKKNKKRQSEPEEAEEGFRIDMDDDRFREIFEDHDYAIDPNEPEFRKTKAMMKVLDERNKRQDSSRRSRGNTGKESRKRKAGDVESLVEKLKRKYRK
ncbi:pre-rRNA-processing protein ESF1 ASCRUDRAFT_32498 [Ascoidea rubescens DSM 1968]|uniref:Uncharacterized protein n=1 Tax=Ascoidea rubescens DSM 1968 TaxID=1344418 RepID=A0A1D2VL38_9ASCO|nr:hypothetical protein ASCRUDRAFT_32498 [Ascoidea rubescens DSM 1968]ODV62312.1 hypothetical protein ASCRUDRAFT_32498 [Ascoidea rubescens DSM 1968]